MPPDLPALAQGFNDSWNAGDMTAVRELLHPDIIVRAPEGWPEPGPFVGRDAVMRQFEQLREPFESDELENISVDVVGDRIAARFIWHIEGQGPEQTMEMTSVVTVRDGKMIHVDYFRDHADALAALGLA